jgi:hypothetical protein
MGSQTWKIGADPPDGPQCCPCFIGGGIFAPWQSAGSGVLNALQVLGQ